MIQRQPRGAVQALGRIGDPSVGPFLLNLYDCEDSLGAGGALGMLKYRPAVPALVSCLRHSQKANHGILILKDLLEIGDSAALPEMEKFVQSLPSADQSAQKAGARILAQMRDQDSVGVLLRMFEQEPDEHERIELLWDLGRYPDQRVIERLFALAVSSDSTMFRGNAIWTLSRMGSQEALTALVGVLETNTPPPIRFDKPAILDGQPADYSKKQAERALREATHQDFGFDPQKWRRWITENR